jgi:hypothetical protein
MSHSPSTPRKPHVAHGRRLELAVKVCSVIGTLGAFFLLLNFQFYLDQMSDGASNSAKSSEYSSGKTSDARYIFLYDNQRAQEIEIQKLSASTHTSLENEERQRAVLQPRLDSEAVLASKAGPKDVENSPLPHMSWWKTVIIKCDDYLISKLSHENIRNDSADRQFVLFGWAAATFLTGFAALGAILDLILFWCRN